MATRQGEAASVAADGTSSRARGSRVRESRWISAVGVSSVLALVAVLVPLVLISRYNHSYADDWHYGVWAHLALEDSGGNVLLALVTALEQVGKAWFEWQGTYSAIFLMAFEPGIFGEQWYVLAAPLVMASLVAGTLYFTHAVLVRLLHAERGVWIGVSCAVLVVQLLLQVSPVEGIFWYNSAVYYTTYHAAMLALLGVLARACDPARTRAPRAAVVWSVVLGLFVAGGNFVTALVTLEVVGALLVALLVRGRRSSMAVLPCFCVMVIGVALSLAAPGNEVRQLTQFPGDGAGVWGTVWQSSLAAFQYVQTWTSGLVLLLLAFCAPLAVRSMGRAAERGARFPLPGLLSVGSMALFATSFTPTFWSMGEVGPGRVQNARFDLYVVLLVVNLFWWCGWLAARRRAAGMGAAREPVMTARQVALACGLAGLVALCVVGSMAQDKDLGEDLTSVSAARSLASGQAAAYDEQVWDRLTTIEDSPEGSLRVPFYSDIPHVLLMGDIRDNMDNYINFRLAQWFRKDSIVGYTAPTGTLASSVVGAPVTGEQR